jgi:hypothetical protein
MFKRIRSKEDNYNDLIINKFKKNMKEIKNKILRRDRFLINEYEKNYLNNIHSMMLEDVEKYIKKSNSPAKKKIFYINKYCEIYEDIYYHFNILESVYSEYLRSRTDENIVMFFENIGARLDDKYDEIFKDVYLRYGWYSIKNKIYDDFINEVEDLELDMSEILLKLDLRIISNIESNFLDITEIKIRENYLSLYNLFQIIIEREKNSLKESMNKLFDIKNNLLKFREDYNEYYLREIANLELQNDFIYDIKKEMVLVKDRRYFYSKVIKKYLNYSELKELSEIATSTFLILDHMPSSTEIRNKLLSMGVIDSIKSSSRNNDQLIKFVNLLENSFVSIIESSINMAAQAYH